MTCSLFFFAAEAEEPLSAEARSYDLVLRAAQFADRAGFDAVWVPERHFDVFGGPYSDPAVLAAAIAVTTERIGIRAGSVVLPLADPIRVAEQWAIVDNLSGGRVGISFASGWHPDDFALAPSSYTSRKQVLVEKLDEVRRLWGHGAVTRTNGVGRPVEVRTFPRPIQHDVPVWLTSSSNIETWRTAAAVGANVLTGLLEQNVTELAAKVDAYRQALAAAGRDPAAHRVTLMLHTFVGDDVGVVRETVRGPFLAYLRRHIELYAKRVASEDLGIEPDSVSEADKEALVEFAFERYFTQHGLFGTAESCLPLVRELAGAGVDELAHLIDFGVDTDVVLANLEHLAGLRSLLHGDLDRPR